MEVVGPDTVSVSGYGNPSAQPGEDDEEQVCFLSFAFKKDGQVVGPCVNPIVEVRQFELVDTIQDRWEPTPWYMDTNVFWDNSGQRVMHRFRLRCDQFDHLPPDECPGSMVRWQYRLRYGKRCSDYPSKTYTTPRYESNVKRTGECRWELCGGVVN